MVARRFFLPAAAISAFGASRHVEVAVNAYTRNILRLVSRDARAGVELDLAGDPAVQRALGTRGSGRARGQGDGLLEAPPTREQVRRLRVLLGRVTASAQERPGHLGEPFDRNLRLVGRELGFDAVSLDVMRLLVAKALHRPFARFFDGFPLLGIEDAATILAAAVGRAWGDVRARIAPDGPLAGSGLVRLHVADDPFDGTRLVVDRRLVPAVAQSSLGREDLLARFLTPERPAALTLTDYGHLAGEVAVAARLARGALDAGERGVNLLLHGPSGTGKTELARVLAHEVGASLFLAAGSGEGGAPPSADDRIAALRLAQTLPRGGRAIVLFDELQDLVERRLFAFGDGALRASKLFLTRLLEENRVVTIWTSNDLSELDPALVRRFAFVLELPRFSTTQRRTVWNRVAAELSPSERDALSTTYDVSPADIASAARAARVAGRGVADRDTLERILDGVVRAVSGRRPLRRRASGAGYRLEVLNASYDLGTLLDDVAAGASRGGGAALLLHGPPGTGKTAFARHLAERIGRSLVVRRASDIEGMFVGESEKNLARAFDEAETQRAVLLFDEVDSFLRDRRVTFQRWELTLTNEYLQQLESFEGIVVCTTNLLDVIDRAALRRFTHKVEFKAMRPEQAAILFASVLGPFLDAEPDVGDLVTAFQRMPSVVPGDFGAVQRRFAISSTARSIEELLREIEAETRNRHHTQRVVGFSV